MLLFSFIWLFCPLVPRSDIKGLQFLRNSHTNTHTRTAGFKMCEQVHNRTHAPAVHMINTQTPTKSGTRGRIGRYNCIHISLHPFVSSHMHRHTIPTVGTESQNKDVARSPHSHKGDGPRLGLVKNCHTWVHCELLKPVSVSQMTRDLTLKFHKRLGKND